MLNVQVAAGVLTKLRVAGYECVCSIKVLDTCAQEKYSTHVLNKHIYSRNFEFESMYSIKILDTCAQ